MGARSAEKFLIYQLIFLNKFLTNRHAQRGKFLNLCVDKIGFRPRSNLCVDIIGSWPRKIFCVAKIGSRPAEILVLAHFLFENR